MELATMTAQEFGELIRTHREAQGFAVEDIAARLKLSKSTVRAIENGQIEDMPHAVYAKGFVRSYAHAVGMAADDLQAGLVAFFPDTQFDHVPIQPGPASGKPSNEAGRGGFAKIFILLLVLGCLGGAGWYVFTNFDSLKEHIMKPLSAVSSEMNVVSRENTSVPVATHESETPAVMSHVPSPQSVRATAPSVNLVENSSVESDTEEPEVSNTQAAAVQPDSHSAPLAESAAEPVTVAGKYVVVQANEECWVQVSVDGGGSRTFTVSAGETSLLPYKNKMTLVLGNSGGASLSHNGKPYALNGKRNEKRTITFQ